MCVQVVNAFFTQYTKMSKEEVEEETDRDNFLSPMTAIEKGLIDRVLAR